MTADALDGLAQLWRRVRRRDVFPVDPLRHMLAIVGCRPSLCSPDPLRRLIADNLDYRQLQDATVPLHLITTNMHTREQVCLSTGDIVPAVLASAAVPAVFPAVQLDGMLLCDGGLAATGGISRAVALGADEVYLLPAGYACAPLCPLSVSPLDFTQAGELIGRAYQETSTWLDERGDRLPHPERFLSPHDHGPMLPAAAARPAWPRLRRKMVLPGWRSVPAASGHTITDPHSRRNNT